MKPAASASDAHPLTTPSTENRNPEDPLAQFNTGEPLSTERRSRAPDALFEKDELFKSDSIFNDSTPTTLVQPAAEKAAQPKAKGVRSIRWRCLAAATPHPRSLTATIRLA